jgi:hypothetical protein
MPMIFELIKRYNCSHFPSIQKETKLLMVQAKSNIEKVTQRQIFYSFTGEWKMAAQAFLWSHGAKEKRRNQERTAAFLLCSVCFFLPCSGIAIELRLPNAERQPLNNRYRIRDD